MLDYLRSSASLPLISVLIGGCGSVVVVSDVEVDESVWNETVAELSPIASSDLECESQDIDLSIQRMQDGVPSQVSADGCGQEQAYTRVGTDWFGSNHDGAAASAEREEQERQRREELRQELNQ